MGLEIERKFLVRDLSAIEGLRGIEIRQGYLATDPRRTVRIRGAGDRGFITIKGPSAGSARPEYEYEIPREDADELLDSLALRPIIEKVRYRVPYAGRTWELDVFHGVNEGLVVAEVELPSEDSDVSLPPWVALEVTGDVRYYNANLIAHPFRDWPAASR